MDFSSDNATFAFSRLQWEPAIVGLVVFNKIWTEANMAEESLAVGAIVDGDVDFCVISNNITWKLLGSECLQVKKRRHLQNCFVFPLGGGDLLERAIVPRV